jgi:expansin (peptidoglycan-binding protein)
MFARSTRGALGSVGVALLALAGCGSEMPGGVTIQELTSNGVSATLSLQSDWGAGFCAGVTVTNTSAAAITSWQVLVNLNQATVNQSWNASVTASGGQLTAAPLSWNAAIAPAASVTFGFCATTAGSANRPALISVTATGAGITAGGGSGSAGTGGASGTGGATSTSGTGGKMGTGGAIAGTGGAASSAGTGGKVGTGGAIATAGTGGAVSSAGTGGKVGTGGAIATTGAGGAIAMAGTGGKIAGTGGAVATAGTGGAPGGGPACNRSLPQYNGNGSVTWYTFSQGSNGQVNCSYPVLQQSPDVVAHVATGNGQFFAAMNDFDYQSGGLCGACAQVTTGDGRTVAVTVVDECPFASNPKCTKGHLDLSQAAFAQIGNTSDGYLGTGNGGLKTTISWKFIACPVAENLDVRLKEGTNQFWNEILVEAERYPIAKVEVSINGSWVAAAIDSSDRYWLPPNGSMGAQPYQVRVTDINGSVIQTSMTLKDGDQPAASQFPLCQ